MFDYCFKYASWAGDFYSDPVEIISPDSRLTKVTLEVNTKMHSLETSVYFSGEYTKEEAQACADDVALWTLNQLSRHTNRYFGDLNFQSGTQITANADGTQSVVDYANKPAIPIGLSGRFNVGYTPAQQAEIIKKAMEQGRRPGDDNFASYRAALVADDIVVRFMSLYLILMSYHHDDMDDTDSYIHREKKLKQEPSIRKQWNKRTKIEKEVPKLETTYTRLRNEVGHNRGVALESTREEMGRHLGGLMELVKACIENPPAPPSVHP